MYSFLSKGCIYLSLAILVSCGGSQKAGTFDYNKSLDYCLSQAQKTAALLHDSTLIPRSIANGKTGWRLVSYRDWTSGFWPGILWYTYEYSKDSKWKEEADRFSKALFSLVDTAAEGHDMGFQVFCSVGNGYRLTQDTVYKTIILRAADTLSRLFNPKVGTILSWPNNGAGGTDWPLRHNTIIDNMMNLELLFWASKNGGRKDLYDIARKHAETTMHNHFREDYSAYHVVIYDTATGRKVKGITHQGYSDSSMWARGQSWAIYGFTMVYRETKEKQFLEFVEKVADVYLKQLPDDLIPYWDFIAPGIPNAPKDASAAAITASALLELSTFISNAGKANDYRSKAEKMLASLSASYQSGNVNTAFLLHSTGHKPRNSEVDASIIYADYYYIEALLRLKKLKENKPLYQNL